MNIYRTLLAPWIATPRSTRWISVSGLGLFIAIDVLVRIFSNSPQPWLASAAILGVGNGFCWAVLMPNTLLLALDAQRLRLPGIERDAVRSLALYALLTIGVPVLLQLPGGHALNLAIVLVLGAGIGAAYMMLPGNSGFLLCVSLPWLLGATRGLRSMPDLGDPDFVWWGAGGAILLVLIFVLRWRQLLHSGMAGMWSRFNAPMVVNMRRTINTEGAMLSARPNWLSARPDLRHIGPWAPAKSLRVALGGIYMPQTVIGRLYQLVPLAIMLGSLGLLFFFNILRDPTGGLIQSYLSMHGGFIFVGLLSMSSVIVAMAAIGLLDMRWRKLGAELSLLALMPGLGDAQSVKRVLLRTALQKPAVNLMLLTIVSLMAAERTHLGVTVDVAVVVIPLGCFGLLMASALNIFGGCPLYGWGRSLLVIGMFVLAILSIMLPMSWDGSLPTVMSNAVVALIAGWVALALFLLWLGLRGRCGLRQRPHPFLPNGARE